ncbi:DUF11 domain-containing protein [Methanobacterium sp. ACI-7]|uniref:DUF11 domain-containing protein n=1 Tax=unclassified Methanobacterium TaxID=2627676 RepID=UPI0039C1B82C
MKINRSIISVLIILFVAFSALGLAYAAGGTGSGGGGTGGGSGNGTSNTTTNTTNDTVNGTASALISVSIDKSTAKVGDTAIITVTITNNGYLDLTNITVLAPLPEGLEYVSHATDTSKANYSPGNGLWDVGNLKKTSKLNGVKYLYITAKVLSSAENKDLTATAKYKSVDPASPDPTFKTPGTAISNVLKIEKTSTGTGNGTGTGTGNGTSNSGSTNKAALTNAIKNATSTGGVEALQNLNQPTDGSAYEVTNATAPTPQSNSNTAYAVLGGLIIAVLVAIGYFKGVKG